MIELSTIRDLVAIFGVIAGLTYYILTVRNTKKAMRNQNIMNIRERLHNKDTLTDLMELLEMSWKDFEEFTEKYDSTVNMDNYIKRWRIWHMYNGIGYQLHQNLFDIEDLYHLMGGHTAVVPWLKFKSIVLKQREIMDNPDWFIWWESMTEALIDVRVKRGLARELIDPEGYSRHQ